MNYKEIVAEAWEFTQDNKKLAVWYGAIPAFFEIVYDIGYTLYQYYAFLSSKLFEHWTHSFLYLVFTTSVTFIQNHRDLIGPLIIVLIIGLIGYFIIPVICQGALVQLIARIYNGQKVKTHHGLTYGMFYFLQLFEFHLFVGTLSAFSVLTWGAFLVRNTGLEVLSMAIPVFSIAILICLVLAVFLTYAPFYIVIDNDGVFTSIHKSVNLVANHIEETLLLTVLMIIISLRIVFQILFVFIIPAAAFTIFYLFMLAKMPQLAWIIGGLVGGIGLIVSSYLTGLITVFSTAVWTISFLKLTAAEPLSARGEVKVAE